MADDEVCPSERTNPDAVVKKKKKWNKKSRSRKNRMRRDTRPKEKRPTYYTKGAADYVGDSWSDRKFLEGATAVDGSETEVPDTNTDGPDAQPSTSDSVEPASASELDAQPSTSTDSVKPASASESGSSASVESNNTAQEAESKAPNEPKNRKRKRRKKKKKRKWDNDQPKRPGDWSCTICAAHNFASRDTCINCKVKNNTTTASST